MFDRVLTNVVRMHTCAVEIFLSIVGHIELITARISFIRILQCDCAVLSNHLDLRVSRSNSAWVLISSASHVQFFETHPFIEVKGAPLVFVAARLILPRDCRQNLALFSRNPGILQPQDQLRLTVLGQLGFVANPFPEQWRWWRQVNKKRVIRWSQYSYIP